MMILWMAGIAFLAHLVVPHHHNFTASLLGPAHEHACCHEDQNIAHESGHSHDHCDILTILFAGDPPGQFDTETPVTAVTDYPFFTPVGLDLSFTGGKPVPFEDDPVPLLVRFLSAIPPRAPPISV